MPPANRKVLERIFAASQNESNVPTSTLKRDCILVTGGAGYIGSHTVLELLTNGYEVVVVDDLSNSSEESLKRVSELTKSSIRFHRVSICDKANLSQIFDKYPHITGVIHFAGLKSVTESVSTPLKYYTGNVSGSVILLEVMLEHGVYNIVFSSSATVYGQPEELPIPETHSFGPTNPYGRSKLMVEDIIRDTCASEPRLNAAILRYFNPVGAHVSGRIGEDPKGIPNNLMPYLSQVLVGKRPFLNVYGSDYPTRDGTGVRDFVHVVDLAQGHLAALKHICENSPRCVTYNMGTGTGYSVLEMISGMEQASGLKIKYECVERRPGDVGEVVADPSHARRELNWTAKKTVLDMCVDTWRWQSENPDGYGTKTSNEDISPLSVVSSEETTIESPTTDSEEVEFKQKEMFNHRASLKLDTSKLFVDETIYLYTPRRNNGFEGVYSPGYMQPMTLEDIRRQSIHGADGLSFINVQE
ncbi:hypothetical protein HK098_007848 [Nowakowskiella sp. JEL0407]|nr:hypothetical protein HK098_007848 [Nowakowskiella sp. JEL0407]